jgi:GT2 family glycosyltransferase
VLTALATCGGTWEDAGALVAAPFYLLWKLTLAPALLRSARPEAAWVRTERVAPQLLPVMSNEVLDASIVIVSFNTRELLRECLLTVQREAVGVSYEVLVVDNASKDGSAEMVAASFPWVRLIRSHENLGFAAANNRAFAEAQGRCVVLLNSDAFLRPGAVARAVAHMDAAPQVGLGGARLVGRDDSWQPSARMFPSPVNDLLALSGLSVKFPRSRFFGRADRTWDDPSHAAETEWTPGAFAIIRRDVLEQVGYFDERFFLYYEEVDLCRRIRAAGYAVWYWPDVVVVHLGGESSKTVKHLTLASSGSQLTLWRMRSALLYYHKHHGVWGAWLARGLETAWHRARLLRHRHSHDPERQAKAEESHAVCALMRRAWLETHGGRVAPERPW